MILGTTPILTSHYNTLYPYFPGKVIHLNLADNYVDVKGKSFIDYMNAERTGFLINLDLLDTIPKLTVSSTRKMCSIQKRKYGFYVLTI